MNVRRAVAILLALLAGACAGGAVVDETLELTVATFPEQESGHLPAAQVQAILAGEIEPPDYNSDPPTSGPRASQPAACGIFRQPVPYVYQLRNLELGAVAFQYAPSLDSAEVERLERLARRWGEQVIVAPRPGLAAPMVATAWTTLMVLDEVDENLLGLFYETYSGRGPQQQDCPIRVDEGS